MHCVQISALGAVEFCQVVEGSDRIRMLRPKRLLPNRERPLVQGLGFGVATLIVVEQRLYVPE